MNFKFFMAKQKERGVKIINSTDLHVVNKVTSSSRVNETNVSIDIFFMIKNRYSNDHYFSFMFFSVFSILTSLSSLN